MKNKNTDLPLPQEHVSNFPTSWWNDRRERDYYIDDSGCVKLKPDSPTAKKLCNFLIAEAHKYANILYKKPDLTASERLYWGDN